MRTILVFGLIWIVVRHIPFIAETTVWQGQSSLVNVFGIPVSLVEVPFIMAGLLIYIKGSVRSSKATRFIHFSVKRHFMFSWEWAMITVFLGVWSWQAFL